MSALIEVQELSKTYAVGATAVQALADVSLQIERGELVAVMGPSGSGKSTLMNLLGLLDRPTSGRYRLAGQDMQGLHHDERAVRRNRDIGFVFQVYSLLPRCTALENVELPLVYAGLDAARRRHEAQRALEAVGLAHRAAHWPQQLSGGEQQRVAIARAIVNDPLLVLADEPTGALDSRRGAEILALFQSLNRGGRTIVIVTHDVDVARHCRRLIAVRDGRLVSDDAVATPLDARRTLDATGSASDDPRVPAAASGSR